MQTKESLRLAIRQQTKKFPPAYFALEDSSSVHALLESPQYRACHTLFAFSPLKSEVDIQPVLRHAMAHKRVALPRCLGETLEFLFVDDTWLAGIHPSPLGILEPATGDVAIPDSYSLILVPAMAYTAGGKRLGRGKGYYDRYLKQYGKIPTLGICRSYQLVEEIPTDGWDVKVDEVLCNGRFYRT